MSRDFYRILDDVREPGRWFLGSPFTETGGAFEPRGFTACRPSGVSEKLQFAIRRNGSPLDFTFADFDVPVLRHALALAVAELAPTSVELIPVTVESEVDRFSILNVVDECDCIDMSASEIQLWAATDGRPERSGKPRMITMLRVDAERAGSRAIFRPKDWHIALVVSDNVRRLLLQWNATGICFEQVST